MDGPTGSIVEFVRSTDAAALSDRAVHAVVRNHLDGVGCAAGGFTSEPAVITRKLAASAQGSPSASVYGLAERSLVEFVALANGTAIRYADYNDVDAVTGVGHPSDMNPALAAMAEATGASGRDLVAAMYVAYQTMGALGGAVPLRDRKWDQGVFCSLGTAAGLAHLLKLDDAQTGHALSIAITPSIALRVTRAGLISHWKGAATAHATMTALLAVRLAQAGMTGPHNVFAGIEGVFEKVTGPFDLGTIAPRGGEMSVAERAQHKYFPVIVESQGPVQLMLEVRDKFALDDLASIVLELDHLGWHEGGGGQGDTAQKWDPQTRETADHSLPYVMAVALVDGRVTLDSFESARVKDPALRPIMQKIAIRENKQYTARRASHGELIAVADVTLRDGRKLRVETRLPRGHRDNPMTDDELNRKFDPMVEKVLTRAEHDELRDRLWNLPREQGLERIFELFRNFGSAR
jgi:2-methylcitrate dehydratase